MKCPKCRAEIVSNTVKTCPYCGSPLAVTQGKNRKVEHITDFETRKVAEKIKEAIETQKPVYRPEKAVVAKKVERVEWRTYSTYDIVILLVSLFLTFLVLTLTFSLLIRRAAL